MQSKYFLTACALGSALSLTVAVGAASAQKGTIQKADPTIHGDGSMSPAAAAAMARNRLLMNDADAAAKRATTQAAREDAKAARAAPGFAPSNEEGGTDSAALAPTVVSGHSFAGLSSTGSSPSDSTGAIGRTTYIQMVNTTARIYNRNTHAVIATGTLNELSGNASTVNSFDPQIIWDPTTNRFYYAMDSIFSGSDNRISFGWSKTSNPTAFNGAHWCHYTYSAPNPARFQDYPKLGDSRDFIIIGSNAFQPSFVGSDLLAVGKPPAGTTCPASPTFGAVFDLRDTGSAQIFTPTPSNQVDNNASGHVVARNSALPSDKLWFIKITKAAGTGLPVFGAARSITVPSYTIPPDADQPTFPQVLDTLDARPTQAVQAINRDRGNIHSFWVQHTVKHATENRAVVRWYEINPALATPVLLRSGEIGTNSAGSHFFNAAISPDRRKDGNTVEFGDSFVINYNVSSAANNIPPRIVAASSFNGRAVAFLLVQSGVGPYRDFSCLGSDVFCRWGDYAGASPDPRPTTTGRGQVWGTSQYSGVVNPPVSGPNYRTWIFGIRP